MVIHLRKTCISEVFYTLDIGTQAEYFMIEDVI